MDYRTEIFVMNNNSYLAEKFGDSLLQNVKLSNYSWFNLGGEAEFFFKPKDEKQLINFFAEIKKTNLKTTFIGAGSNTLFRDNGVKGVVIKLGKSFSNIKKIDDNVLEVGAAALDRKVADYAKDNDLCNFEFLSCIPGSIGGAIIMNSGCYNTDISKVILSIKAIDKKTCKVVNIKKEDIRFNYRGTNLSKDLMIISAKLQGSHSKKEIIEKTQSILIKRKKLSQPNKIKTCGSTFKNISKNKKAWMLIKEAGCENFSEGGAKISEKHCNFFINNGNAKSADIEKLIKKVKESVYKKTKINLELEIQIIGE